MNPFIIILSGKRILRTMIVTFSLVGLLSIFYFQQEITREALSPLRGDGPPGAVYSVKTEKKQLALTFDIGWGEERVGPILDILEKNGIQKATFFLSSPWAEAHPEIVKRIADRYEVGSHGHRHDNYSTYKEAKMREQIGKADHILTELTGKKPRLIRFPNGDFDKRVLRVAHELGYKSIQWDTDSLDWTNPGTQKIINRVLKKAHAGDIILMHASDSCRQTHEALPTIISQLRAQGYTFVTVSELLADADAQAGPVD